MVDKALRIMRGDGVPALFTRGIAYLYRHGVRPWLPVSGHVRYAGLPTALERKWGDWLVPRLWKPEGTQDIPDYEASLVAAIRRHVMPGDQVVVVGGGVGLTVTMAALQGGPTASVTCYEAAAEGVEKVRRTAALNGVADRVRVEHAVVGRPIAVYGSRPDRQVIHAHELPDCDVLELDCEGAEIDILTGLSIRPRVILVETHGFYGASTDLVISLLRRQGYVPEIMGVAEPRATAQCELNDIRVIAATREDLLPL